MAQIRISVIRKGYTSYFYYPDRSCKTKDGGMKMLLKSLKEEKIPYELEVSYSD